MQLDYAIYPPVAHLGMLADPGHNDIVSAESYSTSTFDVGVQTVQNSTAYTVTFPLATPVVATYTSTGSATQALILAGVAAAVNALTGANAVPFVAVVNDATNGPIFLKAKYGGVTIIPTVSANLNIAADSGIIPYGTLVVMDSLPSAGSALTARKCRLPQVAGDIGLLSMGVAISTQFAEQPYSPIPGQQAFGATALAANVPAYLINSSVNVLRQGRVWCAPENTVAAGDPVYVRTVAGAGGTQKGAMRNNADSGSATLLSGAKWLDAAVGVATYGTGGPASLSRLQLNIA